MHIRHRTHSLRVSALLAASIQLVVSGASHAVDPGELAPPDVQQLLHAQSRELETAMAAGNEAEIRRIVDVIKETVGDYAGIPESPERYHYPIDPSPPEFDKILGTMVRGPRYPTGKCWRRYAPRGTKIRSKCGRPHTSRSSALPPQNPV